MKKSTKNNAYTPKWVIQFCAIAAISSTLTGIFANKEITKAVATSAGAVLWGIGSGMAFTNLLYRKNEHN